MPAQVLCDNTVLSHMNGLQEGILIGVLHWTCFWGLSNFARNLDARSDILQFRRISMILRDKWINFRCYRTVKTKLQQGRAMQEPARFTCSCDLLHPGHGQPFCKMFSAQPGLQYVGCSSEVWLELTTLHFFPSSSKTGVWLCCGEFLGEVGLGVWLFVGERTGGHWARRLGFLWVFWSSETWRSPKKKRHLWENLFSSLKGVNI